MNILKLNYEAISKIQMILSDHQKVHLLQNRGSLFIVKKFKFTFPLKIFLAHKDNSLIQLIGEIILQLFNLLTILIKFPQCLFTNLWKVI